MERSLMDGPPICVMLSRTSMAYVNQHIALVMSEDYHVVITTNICVNRTAQNL